MEINNIKNMSKLKNKMTKQLFLDGVTFTYDGENKMYTYTPNDSGFGCVSKIYAELKWSMHEMNVEAIGTRFVTCYTFLFNKKIVIKVRYEDMVVYEAPASHEAPASPPVV